MLLGDDSLGSPLPIGGLIRNLDIMQTGPVQAAATWDLQGTGKPYVYLDGYLSSIPAGNVASLSSLSEGAHNISVISLAETQRNPSIFYDNVDGTRVLLRWPMGDASTAKYVLYGRHEEGSWGVIKEVSESLISPLSYAYPKTGTGTGRISVPSIGADPANLTMAIEITGEGEAMWSTGMDYDIISFAPGGVSYLTYGIQVNWQDTLDKYHVGDIWYIGIGVATETLTDELAPGTWDFRVRAANEAGFESDPIDMPGQVYIPDYPLSVALPEAMTYEDGVLSFVLDLPAGVEGVKIMTNYDSITGVYEPYVEEGRPLLDTTDGEVELVLPEGDLLLYLWPYSASGALLRDFTLYRITLPVDTIDSLLSPPANLTARVVAGVTPTYKLTWTYELQEGDALDNFQVMRDEEVVASVLWSAGVGSPVIHYEITIEDDEISWGDTIFLKVRAYDGEALAYRDSVEVELTLSNEAPSLSGILEGGVA